MVLFFLSFFPSSFPSFSSFIHLPSNHISFTFFSSLLTPSFWNLVIKHCIICISISRREWILRQCKELHSSLGDLFQYSKASARAWFVKLKSWCGEEAAAAWGQTNTSSRDADQQPMRMKRNLKMISVTRLGENKKNVQLKNFGAECREPVGWRSNYHDERLLSHSKHGWWSNT